MDMVTAPQPLQPASRPLRSALNHVLFFSDTLGMATGMNVILPDSREPDRAWPCLYLLHGLSDDHTTWQRRTSIERYAAPLGLVVVMPNAHRSFYCDMANGYRYWTFISQELPAVVQTLFHVSSLREHTFVAGLSMGGYGAFKLALNMPERFAAAASLSGALDMAAAVLEHPPERNWDFDLIFGRSADIRGTDNDLFTCAERVARMPASCRPALYQCCGTEDFLYAQNLKFRDFARGLGLNLTYEQGPGAHHWGYWDQQIQRVLEWLPLPGRSD